MEIQEISRRKKVLQFKIRYLIQEFERNTNCLVENIEIKTINTVGIGDGKVKRSEVQIETKIIVQ